MKSSSPFVRDRNGMYVVIGSRVHRDDIIAKAKSLVSQSMRRGSNVISSPETLRDYLTLHLAGEINEKFWGLFLDNRHRVLVHSVLSVGTIDSAAVYPRTVIKKALDVNAAAVVFAHNHSSGVAEPSDTDVRLTRNLSEGLALLDIRVLDHLIVGHESTVSLAERGLM